MNHKELANAVYHASHLTGDFLLRSGVRSAEYFDKYQFESRPELLSEITNQLVELLPTDFDAFAGLEMGGIPLATALSLKTGKPVVFVRKKAKEYGTCRVSEGGDVAGKKLLVVEDVVTSGGQLLLSIDDLRKAGAEIAQAICVIDRQSGGSDALAKIGVELKSLFTMSVLKENA